MIQLYCASVLSMFLKRSAVLYLSSTLHCNHWFFPVGQHGCAFMCPLLAGFCGWSLFFGHFIALCVFLTVFHVKHLKKSLFLHFLLCLFGLTFSKRLSHHSQSCQLSCTTVHPSTCQNEHKFIFSYLLSSVNWRIKSGIYKKGPLLLHKQIKKHQHNFVTLDLFESHLGGTKI